MKKFKTVDELISQLQPDKPVYCIRKKSIQVASKLFQEKFPGKILYAVKTNPNKEVLKTIIQSGIKQFDVASVEEINQLGTTITRLNKEIVRLENVGGETGDLRDQRDMAVRALSEFTEVKGYEAGRGEYVVNLVGWGSLVAGGSLNPLVARDVTGNKQSGSYSNEGRLEIAFENRLGNITSISRRERFSISSRHAKTYIGPRLALIGDAAHTILPLAGLGANQGIIDAAALAELVAHGMSQNIDFGNRSTLRRYERWRKTENQLILKSLDGLFYWFQSQDKMIRASRALGLNLTNNIKPIRMVFLKRAVGLSGELPKIAKSLPIA